MLTKRQMEVLQVAATGALDEKIAERLGITCHTVHSHMSHIYEKMDLYKSECNMRVSAIMKGIKLGLITFPKDDQ